MDFDSRTNTENVEKVLVKLNNPNPIFIATIVVSIIFFINFTFILCKRSMSGTWTDRNTNAKFIIKHNKFTNSLKIEGENSAMYGIVDGSGILLVNGDKGVFYKRDDEIFWINGSHWVKQYYL
jgi:hypothetical protein